MAGRNYKSNSMENIKKFIKTIANVLNKIMHIHIYICLYPFVSFILYNYFNVNLLPNKLADEFKNLLIWSSYYSLSGLSIPTYLWCILSFLFEKIHPIITIIYFILFLLTGIFCFIGAFIAIGYGMR